MTLPKAANQLSILGRRSWSQRRGKLFGLDEEKSKLKTLVETSVKFAQSNSIILIGPPGSGKSSLVESVISGVEDDIVKIHLNGNIHNNDKITIKAIVTQMLVDKNQIEDASSLDYSTSLTVILEMLHSKRNYVPLVFILENMEAFCFQERQIILYNLFDAVQASKMTIIVIGTTSFIDIIDLFEKRGISLIIGYTVKSRFSHRTLSIYPLDYQGLFEILVDTLSSVI